MFGLGRGTVFGLAATIGAAGGTIVWAARAPTFVGGGTTVPACSDFGSNLHGGGVDGGIGPAATAFCGTSSGA